MAVEQVAALVGVAVAGEHQVDAQALEDRQRVLAHVGHPTVGVGVVRPLAVGRMVPVGDHPVAAVGGEVGGQPGEHGAGGRAVALEGVEADEVEVAVVERVVGLGPRRHAARLGGPRQGEDVVVGTGLGGGVGAGAVVVAEGGPQHRGAQLARVHVEDGGLVLGVGAGDVGVVAEHQPEVGPAVGGERLVGVAHRAGVGVGGPRVAHHPDAGRPGEARRRAGDEGVIGVSAGQQRPGAAALPSRNRPSRARGRRARPGARWWAPGRPQPRRGTAARNRSGRGCRWRRRCASGRRGRSGCRAGGTVRGEVARLRRCRWRRWRWCRRQGRRPSRREAGFHSRPWAGGAAAAPAPPDPGLPARTPAPLPGADRERGERPPPARRRGRPLRPTPSRVRRRRGPGGDGP